MGKVIGCDIDEDKYSEDKVELRSNIPNIYHVTGNKFMINGKLKYEKNCRNINWISKDTTYIVCTLGGLLIGIWKKKYLLLKCHKNEIII